MPRKFIPVKAKQRQKDGGYKMINMLLSIAKCKSRVYTFVNAVFYKFALFFTSLDLNGILYYDLTSFDFKISTATFRKNSR